MAFIALAWLWPVGAAAQTAWPSWGNGDADTSAGHSDAGPGQLNPSTVGRLRVKWFTPIPVGGSTTPTVEPGGLYFVAQNGQLLKLDPTTGALLWSARVCDYVGLASAASGTSPAIARDRIVLGVGGWVIAVDKMTGQLIWKTLVDANPYATVHASPVIARGHVFTGVASTEENHVTMDPGYQPVFRGSAVSLNLATGAIEWQFRTVPAGYAGGAIWGSSPAVDLGLGLVFFTTGNNYAVPPSVGRCIRAAGSRRAMQTACVDPTDLIDSIIALDMTTGALVWWRPTGGADAWLPLASCASATVLYCPTVSKPMDADFAQGPVRLYVHDFVGVPDDRGGVSANYVLGAGQKTSVFWGLNPINGGLFWSTRLATTDGQLKFGSAGDSAHNMFFAALDSESRVLTNSLVGRNGVPVCNWIGGSWAGLDAATGAIKFQIPVVGWALDDPRFPGQTPGSMAVGNGGLVFAGSTSGYMVAFDTTGYVHWTFNSGGVVASHPAIVNDWVYWSTGNYTPAVANAVSGIYAFSLQ
jgi:polyvinyl alcohol dehydrogenase (cytochrome)